MGKVHEMIISNIREFIIKNGGVYSNFYIGITNDLNRRFNEHNVNTETSICKTLKADSDAIARNVEQYFIDKGCKGGSGGGDESSRFIYCYKIANTTKQ